MDYQCTQPSEEIDKIIQRTQERGIEICRQNEELNRVHEETMQILRELIKVQDEKRIAKEKEAARQEEEKRIAKEKEAAELEAKHKSQECLNIEEKSIPQASIRSRKSRIDPTLSKFTVSTKRIPLSDFIPPVTPNVETVNSLRMGDKHLDTQKGSLESSVKDPIPIPSESADLSDGESDCDVPVNDESSPIFSTFDNPLFDSNDDFSSDDESLSEEEIQKDEFKYFSNPLYDLDDEIITNEKILPNQKDLDVVIPIPPGIDERCFNAESDLLESLLNRDSPIDSTKIDSIFDEFSLPRPPEESNSEISDATIESLSPSPILIEDSDLFLASDDSMPLGIKIVDYDSEGDIRFLEELLNSDSHPLPENESFSLDHFDDPSLPCPPSEPPDVEICFNFEPDAGIVTNKVVGDISEHDVLMPNLLPTQPTFYPVYDTLLPFLSKNEEKCSIMGTFLTWMSRFSISILLDQLKYEGSSQAQDSVNKNKRFSG
ncbi:hypothetical protein Tco_0811679, partial [Tanacetum coccineum]